jgi:CRISPR system Cascade subunit CasA
MNLTTDAWIPVLRADGNGADVSLLEAFNQGREIADLSVRPHERIALLRLLICIAQAALEGPKDEDEWRGCLEEIPKCVADYLALWRHAFELFGEGQRFLQAKGRGTPGEMSVNKLQFIDKDTTTLFDNEVQETNERSEQWLALALVVYQSFAAGGKVGGSEELGGKTVPQSGTNAPCRDQNAFHAFIRMPTLLETIHANMLYREAIEERGLKPLVWGERPIWEFDPGLAGVAQSKRSLAGSYLGRLAPLSRSVWLNTDHRTASNANGQGFGNFAEGGFREPSCSIIRFRDRAGKEDFKLVSAGKDAMGRSAWRQLHAMLLKSNAAAKLGGAACIYNLPEDGNFDLWVGALVADQAKIIDAVESVYSLPANLLAEAGREIYKEGVDFADMLSRQLMRAVKAFRLAIEKTALNQKQQIEKGAKLPRAERERYSNVLEDASLPYWTAAESLVPELFRLVTNPPPVQNARYQFTDTAWGKALFTAALDAYDLACPHATPRQMQAYVLGRGQFFRTVEPTETPTDEKEESNA